MLHKNSAFEGAIGLLGISKKAGTEKGTDLFLIK